MLDEDRFADLVIVPDVVGLPFSVAQAEAYEHGVVLANPDPDGPPISGIAWPHDPVVAGQDPAPGAVVYRNDSLRVRLRLGPEPMHDRASSSDVPPRDRAHAEPEQRPEFVDLTDDGVSATGE